MDDLKWKSSSGFTVIPNWIFERADITKYEQAAYIAVARYVNATKGYAWPAMADLVATAKVGETRLREGLSGLRVKGILTTTRRQYGVEYRLSEVNPDPHPVSSSPPINSDPHQVTTKRTKNKDEVQTLAVPRSRSGIGVSAKRKSIAEENRENPEVIAVLDEYERVALLPFGVVHKRSDRRIAQVVAALKEADGGAEQLMACIRSDVAWRMANQPQSLRKGKDRKYDIGDSISTGFMQRGTNVSLPQMLTKKASGDPGKDWTPTPGSGMTTFQKQHLADMKEGLELMVERNFRGPTPEEEQDPMAMRDFAEYPERIAGRVKYLADKFGVGATINNGMVKFDG